MSDTAQKTQNDAGIAPREFWAQIVTYVAVLGSTLFILLQLHPALLFSSSTDVGGDNAAHVAASYYFLHDLFPHLQLSGWDPQWFGGFPLYVFYFPLPAVITAILSGVFSFSAAFKIVTVLGSLLLPLSAYLFARLAGFARPVPALMSVGSLAFLFNTSYTIDGGNLPSTLAGEYSFSLSLDFALLFLGVLIYALRTGRLRWLAPVLFALTLLCHVVPALFAAGAAAIIIATWRDRGRAFRIIFPVGIVGGLLSAFWLMRFALDLPYSSSMGYTRVTGVFSNLLPHTGELTVQILAVVGFGYAIARGQRVILALSLMAIGSALAFNYLPSGLVFNGRWLPFWFLTTTLVASYAIAELGSSFFALFGFRWLSPILTGALGFLAIMAVVAGYMGVLPFYSTANGAKSFIPSWINWNYTGYQGKPGWTNYESLVSMLEHASAQHGCGRLDYEYSPNFNNPYGSTLVPMSLPMWTNGCIQTAEGLYFESSTSTPFHFLDQAELSIQPSNPVVGLPYQTLNVADGVRHLAITGVQYFLANSAEVEQQANADPQLTEIASTPAYPAAVETANGYSNAHPKWILYSISSAPIVRPLSYEPVVETGLSKTQWLTSALSWYQNEKDWPVVLTTTGPSTWRHVANGLLVSPNQEKQVTNTSVSGVKMTNTSISFDASQLGAPVVVNVPYFPNWSAVGATGPYLASPNMMVVVPTSHHVTLSYGPTAADWAGRALTIIGIIALFGLKKSLPADPRPIEATPTWVTNLQIRRESQREQKHKGESATEFGSEDDQEDDDVLVSSQHDH